MHLPSWGTFQLLVTLLLRYRSQAVFSLGSWCLPASRGNSNPRYSSTCHIPLIYVYVAITLYGAPFQRTSTSSGRDADGISYNPTSPPAFTEGFGLDSAAFTRRYSRYPSWFLFLPLLRCFNPGRSQSLRIDAFASGCPIRRSPGLRFHAPHRGLSQLGTSFISA